MADYPISKEAVQKMLIDLRNSLGNERYISIGISMALHHLEGFPQMDAAEVKHGHWYFLQYDTNPKIGNWHCSVCNRIMPSEWVALSNYCPKCGAKMDAKEE